MWQMRPTAALSPHMLLAVTKICVLNVSQLHELTEGFYICCEGKIIIIVIIYKCYWCVCVCIAGAVVSLRGGRGKLSRDTNENEEREDPLLSFFFYFTLSFNLLSRPPSTSSSSSAGPVGCLRLTGLADHSGSRICLLSWLTGLCCSGLTREADTCLLFHVGALNED